jgi:hypothetical protein
VAHLFFIYLFIFFYYIADQDEEDICSLPAVKKLFKISGFRQEELLPRGNELVARGQHVVNGTVWVKKYLYRDHVHGIVNVWIAWLTRDEKVMFMLLTRHNHLIITNFFKIL